MDQNDYEELLIAGNLDKMHHYKFLLTNYIPPTSAPIVDFCIFMSRPNYCQLDLR
jgi:hypothetical protein